MVVAYEILVSAQGPLVLGFWFGVFGAKGLGPGPGLLDLWMTVGKCCAISLQKIV